MSRAKAKFTVLSVLKGKTERHRVFVQAIMLRGEPFLEDGRLSGGSGIRLSPDVFRKDHDYIVLAWTTSLDPGEASSLHFAGLKGMPVLPATPANLAAVRAALEQARPDPAGSP